MARKAALYTIAFIDADGDLDVATYGDDLASAKERLATFAEGKAKIWDRPPLPHRIRREPTVEIGEPAAPPKKRGRKKKVPVEAAGNGAVETPAVTPAVAARGKTAAPEA